jgi:hypothetical protein
MTSADRWLAYCVRVSGDLAELQLRAEAQSNDALAAKLAAAREPLEGIGAMSPAERYRALHHVVDILRPEQYH